MKTRTLLLLALACGVAIMAAGAVFLQQLPDVRGRKNVTVFRQVFSEHRRAVIAQPPAQRNKKSTLFRVRDRPG